MLKQSRSFPCCQGTFRAVTKLQQNKKRQKLTGLLASARSPVWASEILWWRWWPIQTPYHAFYTTLHNVQYQTVSAAIPATQDKPSCIVTYLHLKTWGRKMLSEDKLTTSGLRNGAQWAPLFFTTRLIVDWFSTTHAWHDPWEHALELGFPALHNWGCLAKSCTAGILLESFRSCLFKY